MLKWQLELGEYVTRLSNFELLTSVLVQEQGDDYDGCMTKRGAFTLQIYL